MFEFNTDRLWSKINIRGNNECWEWTAAKSKAGYGMITIDYISKCAHRIVWEVHNQMDIPKKGVICHSCDNRGCCNPYHLFLGSQSDNIKDAANKGRMVRGEKHARSTLTENDIREIRRLGIEDKLTKTEIAKKFDVSRNTITDVILKKTWKHVDPDWESPERKIRGQTHQNAKLSEYQVRKIRKLSEQGESQRSLSKIFGVSRGTIDSLLAGKTWTHVDPDWESPEINTPERHTTTNKLTENNVREIRKLYGNGVTPSDLGQKFSVNKNTIMSILRGDTWVFVDPDWEPPLKSGTKTKLVDDDIQKIRSLHTEMIETEAKLKKLKETVKNLPRRFNVSQTIIRRIIKRQTWKHVD